MTSGGLIALTCNEIRRLFGTFVTEHGRMLGLLAGLVTLADATQACPLINCLGDEVGDRAGPAGLRLSVNRVRDLEIDMDRRDVATAEILCRSTMTRRTTGGRREWVSTPAGCCARPASRARQFCTIRGYLATAAKHGVHFFDALTTTAEGRPCMSEAA